MLRHIITLAAVLPAGLAIAASSPWLESEGGAVRIVTSGLADEEGNLRGVLEIRLQPGWKTYWRDPGDAGVPPQIEMAETSAARSAEIFFPPPEHVGNAYAEWAGYSGGVALPVLFRLGAPGSTGIIEGEVFLGICESVCIPIEVSFAFDTGANPDNPEDAMLVESAFASLPVEAHPGFRLTAVERAEGGLLLRAELPEGAPEPRLFLATPEDVLLSRPRLAAREGGEAAFQAAFQRTPADEAKAMHLHYTLVAGRNAVSGTIALP